MMSTRGAKRPTEERGNLQKKIRRADSSMGRLRDTARWESEQLDTTSHSRVTAGAPEESEQGELGFWIYHGRVD